MADDGIFATNADYLKVCGANVNSTYSATAYTDVYSLMAEAYINDICKFNFSTGTNYSSLTTGVKEILKRWATALVAQYIIMADMSGFPRLLEAQTRLSWLNDVAQGCENLMKEEAQDVVSFVRGI